MEIGFSKPYLRGFVPYALAAFLVGAVGGFTAVLGPAFVLGPLADRIEQKKGEQS